MKRSTENDLRAGTRQDPRANQDWNLGGNRQFGINMKSGDYKKKKEFLKINEKSKMANYPCNAYIFLSILYCPSHYVRLHCILSISD